MTDASTVAADTGAAPKVAIVGNMNNNGFALLRYFCDLGADAHLYAYASDSAGGMAHFGFEADTWYAERWRSRVDELPFDNSSRTLYPLAGGAGRALGAVRVIADSYDLTVGSGIAPALFAKAGRRLTAFYPYATGVELLEHLPFVAAIARKWSRRWLYRYARALQRRGILEAEHCFNAEMSLSAAALQGIGRPFDRLAVPMVYNRELVSEAALSPGLRERARSISAHPFVVFCHSRQVWVPDPTLSEKQFKSYSKNSDWLLRGFADFVHTAQAPNALLCLVEYGPDVEASRRLATELGIAPQVRWLPRMQRREIMHLLSLVDVGVGEFHVDPGILWGGTGWEFLASGKPFLQAFNFTADGYIEQFGHAPPPVLHADSPETVAMQLRRMYSAPDERERIGRANAIWFNENNGIGLARKWLTRMGALSDLRLDL